ncbi:pentatricopeptide repeat-containing protein At3g09040, mitochondrial-like [Cryptomeria japonica]|uniref:pentatricopeptide repeat-containing protein At3g09040, mitochondrial-like n=1 Tax=Cryptomeria japonica TaxID=3369 RepID=UPI0027D9D214|nr:pentatricopeptide repeat-containing protein At3g09040, mitochondrial-like [Cryptomeria japonica]
MFNSCRHAFLRMSFQRVNNSHINEGGFMFATDRLLQNTLIRMYEKCGSLVDAHEVFDQMTERDVFSWNAIIAAYRWHGYPHEALTLFHKMRADGIQPNQFTFASILSACSKVRVLEHGMAIHQSIIECGFLSDSVVANALVDMYAKCGNIRKAHDLFEKLSRRDVVSWTAMVAGYTQNGFVEKALETFKQMQLAVVQPNSATFASILPAYAKMGALEQGMEIHQNIVKRGILSAVVIANALVDMYAKCGSTRKAHKLFDKMPQRDVVSWSAIITGYAQNGFAEKALESFKQMQLAGVNPNSTTFASILPACAKMGALEQGMYIHQSIMERGFISDVVVVNSLLDMYAKCGHIHKARHLFDKIPQKNVVSWTAMITGYAQNGFLDEASRLFREIPQRNVVSWNAMIAGYSQNDFVEKALLTFKEMQLVGLQPNATTFASILPACAKTGALEQGMDIHRSIMERGCLSNVTVGNALVDMYAKCGSIHKARELFDNMAEKNVVSWTAMIAGYAQNGFVERALEIFKQMRVAGVNPDSTTFVSILPACAKMGALEQGMDIHQNIMERGLLSNVVVANALVDMYAKCGSINRARELFEKMSQKNVVSWNALISGYAQNGLCKDALELFELMKQSGTCPDCVSFVCVLLACSHAGLVNEGCEYFNGMTNLYNIMPTIDHYVCMVDLFGRAAYLEETLNFIIKMPITPVVVVWTCFLGSFKAHKNIRLGLYTATLLFELDPKNAATYVILSNIYAEVGMWSEVQLVRKLMKDRGIEKIPGCSWIEGYKTVRGFCVADR